MALELTDRKHDVIATARNASRLDDLEVSERYALDITDDGSVAKVASAVGAVDILVNNAGIGAGGPLEEIPIDVVRLVFETNVVGAYRVTQAFLPEMRKRRSGRIINVSSIAANMVMPLGTLYSASKRALETMSEALRLELGHLGINVVVIEPPILATQFGANSLSTSTTTPEYVDLIERRNKAIVRYIANMMPVEEAIGTMCDIIEMERPEFRYPIGEQSKARWAQRQTQSDAEYEAMIFEQFGFAE
jgi:NAD(P)-dependent dehydrogenase (short-subunit alcohol dehydrogenase family)